MIIYKWLKNFLFRPVVRVQKYDNTWISLAVIKTENGYFVKYLGEVGKLNEDGSIDTGSFLIKWRPYKGRVFSR